MSTLEDVLAFLHLLRKYFVSQRVLVPDAADVAQQQGVDQQPQASLLLVPMRAA
jgi:hypothetical protein